MLAQRESMAGWFSEFLRGPFVGPSVIFIMYGYNESFEGERGAALYTKQLVELVEKYRRLRKEKDCDARFVLFSPIAYEQTGSPNLPDGTQLNTNLAIYTEATRLAATMK